MIELDDIDRRIVAALQAELAVIRRDAAEALVHLGDAAVTAVPALVAALDDADADGDVPFLATWALGRIGPAARDAGPALRSHRTQRPHLVDAALAAIFPGDASP